MQANWVDTSPCSAGQLFKLARLATGEIQAMWREKRFMESMNRRSLC